MGASRAVLGCVLAMALGGCAGDVADDGGPTSTPERTPAGESTSETAVEPTSEPTADGVPDDLLLPRQEDGRAEPDTDVGRLYDYICLDPRQQWTLGMGFLEARTVVLRPPVVIEKLAVYPSARRATRAVDGLVKQVDLCGDSADHVGRPASWRAEAIDDLGDQALLLTYRSEGEVSTVVTVARVGRAVFYVDRRGAYADGVREDARTVEAFLPELAEAFG